MKFTGEPLHIELQDGSFPFFVGRLCEITTKQGDCGDPVRLTTIETAHNDYAAQTGWTEGKTRVGRLVKCILGGRQESEVAIIELTLFQDEDGQRFTRAVVQEPHEHSV